MQLGRLGIYSRRFAVQRCRRKEKAADPGGMGRRLEWPDLCVCVGGGPRSALRSTNAAEANVVTIVDDSSAGQVRNLLRCFAVRRCSQKEAADPGRMGRRLLVGLISASSSGEAVVQRFDPPTQLGQRRDHSRRQFGGAGSESTHPRLADRLGTASVSTQLPEWVHSDPIGCDPLSIRLAANRDPRWSIRSCSSLTSAAPFSMSAPHERNARNARSTMEVNK